MNLYYILTLVVALGTAHCGGTLLRTTQQGLHLATVVEQSLSSPAVVLPLSAALDAYEKAGHTPPPNGTTKYHTAATEKYQKDALAFFATNMNTGSKNAENVEHGPCPATPAKECCALACLASE